MLQYVLGLHLRESHTDNSKYFFGSPSVAENVQPGAYLTRVRETLGREFHNYGDYERATALYDALCIAEQEFLAISWAFNFTYFQDGPEVNGHVRIGPKAKGTSLSTGPDDSMF